MKSSWNRYAWLLLVVALAFGCAKKETTEVAADAGTPKTAANEGQKGAAEAPKALDQKPADKSGDQAEAESTNKKDPAEAKAPAANQPNDPSKLLNSEVELRKEIRARSLVGTIQAPENVHLYEISVDVDPDLLTYQGNMQVLVVNYSQKPWEELHFHLYPNSKEISGALKSLKIDRIRVAGVEAAGQDLGDNYVLKLPSTLEAGGKVVVDVDFRGVMKRGKLTEEEGIDMMEMLMDSMGGGGGDYGIFAYSSGVLSMSLWYPVVAAYDETGWDTQSADDMGDFSYFDVADYRVSVGLPAEWKIATSGSDGPQTEGRRVYLAGAVREFSILAGKGLTLQEQPTKSGGTVKSWVLESDKADGKLQLETGVKSVDYYEQAFGPYPYR